MFTKYGHNALFIKKHSLESDDLIKHKIKNKPNVISFYFVLFFLNAIILFYALFEFMYTEINV